MVASSIIRINRPAVTKQLLEPKFETELAIESPGLPALINQAGEQARERFVEFFTASIRNRGTRAVYANAVQQFLHWCLMRNISKDSSNWQVSSLSADLPRRASVSARIAEL